MGMWRAGDTGRWVPVRKLWGWCTEDATPPAEDAALGCTGPHVLGQGAMESSLSLSWSICPSVPTLQLSCCPAVVSAGPMALPAVPLVPLCLFP